MSQETCRAARLHPNSKAQYPSIFIRRGIYYGKCRVSSFTSLTAFMPSAILYELFNLTVPNPTGIATYARNLTEAAVEMGYTVDGLFHTYLPLSKKDPTLAEVSFFDVRNKKPSFIAKNIELSWRYLIGKPRGLQAVQLPRLGVVIDPSENKFDGYQNAFASRLFMDISRCHFKRYGVSATCHVPVTPTVFHATQPIPLRVPKAPNIYTIHDIVPLRLPYTTLDDKRFFLNMVRHLGRTADHIITVSEASRQDLIKICRVPEDKISNTYQAVSFSAEVLSPSDRNVATFVEEAFDLGYRDYFLFFGALEPKKNVPRLIDAYFMSGTRCPLVIAGGFGWEQNADQDRNRTKEPPDYRLQNRKVLRVGRLPLVQLVALIRGARAVLFPSLYEGFGLPVLESMLLGTPVLTSNVSSLAEISSDAARLVNPYDIADIARGIRDLDQDGDLRAELIGKGRVQAKKFSPENYRSKLAAIYGKFGCQAKAF
ncbi:MAG: glycosyltransferase family 4 protein [Alphaproteobacteria bacterium]|nr:glycosyltransferase family 4 protein [Alphaproteobacteria bacterium]